MLYTVQGRHFYLAQSAGQGERTSGRLVAAMQMTGPASECAPLSKPSSSVRQLVQRLLALVVAHAAQPACRALQACKRTGLSRSRSRVQLPSLLNEGSLLLHNTVCARPHMHARGSMQPDRGFHMRTAR